MDIMDFSDYPDGEKGCKPVVKMSGKAVFTTGEDRRFHND